MASGIDRRNGGRLEGWPFTVQCLNEIATTPIGVRIQREYVGALNPGLLVKKNLMAGPLERFVYATILVWELWVPMYDVKSWRYISDGTERAGGFGILFDGAHYPDAHRGNYALEENRQLRAIIASNAIRFFGA